MNYILFSHGDRAGALPAQIQMYAYNADFRYLAERLCCANSSTNTTVAQKRDTECRLQNTIAQLTLGTETGRNRPNRTQQIESGERSATWFIIVDNAPLPTAHAELLFANGVVHRLPRGARRSTRETYRSQNTNARCACTPPPPLETFSRRISASTCSSMELAGLKKKKKNIMMTQEIVKSVVNVFSLDEHNVNTNLLGAYTTMDGPITVSGVFLRLS